MPHLPFAQTVPPGTVTIQPTGLEPKQSVTYKQIAFFGPKERDVLTAAAGGHAGLNDVVNLAGKSHALDIRASRHPGAPDGIPSSLLTFHDVSALRRLTEHQRAAPERVCDPGRAVQLRGRVARPDGKGVYAKRR